MRVLEMLLGGALLASVGGVAAGQDEAAAAMDTSLRLDPGAGYLVSDTRFHDDPEVLWPGFLSGLRGFEGFYLPVGNPLYFESPINDTRVTFLYLHHDFPSGSQIAGGDLDVVAVQARVALTERWGLIATKDGYSFLDAGAFPEDEGWNDIALGLKYVFHADEETDTVAAVGVRYMTESGSSHVLQGNVQELSPFVSVAKGFEDLHLIGNVTWRAPLDDDDGNHILQWSAHADYEIVDGFAPMVELHGLHYLSDGDRAALSVGGLDYANLGSSDVAGSTVVWAEAGAALRFTPNIELGATYGYGLTNHDADIMEDRFTVLLHFRW